MGPCIVGSRKELDESCAHLGCTKDSKTCLKRHSKIDKTKVLQTNGSFMKVKSIAECSLRSFCNTFDLH